MGWTWWSQLYRLLCWNWLLNCYILLTFLLIVCRCIYYWFDSLVNYGLVLFLFFSRLLFGLRRFFLRDWNLFFTFLFSRCCLLFCWLYYTLSNRLLTYFCLQNLLCFWHLGLDRFLFLCYSWVLFITWQVVSCRFKVFIRGIQWGTWWWLVPFPTLPTT